MSIKQSRFQMVIPPLLKLAAEKKAKSLGISLSEYMKDLMKKDLEYGK